MNSRFTLFLMTLVIFSLSVHKVEAQEKKKFMNETILTEVKTIQKRFSDSISHYNYKKNADLYSKKYKVFYIEKIQSLENLYQSIFDKDVIIGKVNKSISFKTTTGMQAKTPVSPVETAAQSEIKTNSVDIAEVENYKQLEDLKKRLTVDFPVYLIEDDSEGIYRCHLNFFIDVDGKFKNVKYSGSSGTEFNLISALFLYALEGLEKPLLYNKKPIVQQFSQPIVLKFE
ncbi:hypothetical protein HHL23_04675 [Chryseobacterium sp. RP-3-3]|uniref:TonB C-terminal domain-containing protein n=1 Tax=Chryseobacterium antibioticum TaxID=2728847 RepID=A0A7Y0AKK5_9FLAO|nr:hypothetical protein [Chryseobacterium antibioticum]NML69084.1 hypothetical protein [Chryseobacterium antibioticum]